MVFKTDYRLMQVKSIAESEHSAILLTFIKLPLNAGQKYCRMLQGEHSAILLTFIKLPVVIKIFVLSFLSGRFTPVFTVPIKSCLRACKCLSLLKMIIHL